MGGGSKVDTYGCSGGSGNDGDNSDSGFSSFYSTWVPKNKIETKLGPWIHDPLTNILNRITWERINEF